MFKGILRITKLVANLKSEINNKPYNIKNFEIPNEFNNKECHFELDDNNEVIKIEINGQIFELNKICENQHKFKIPKDTCIAIEKTFIDNFHLKLNKYAKFNYNDGYKLQNQNINKDFFDNDWKDFYKSKIDKYYKDIRELNLKFLEEIKLGTDYRLVIGSEQSIYETSIRLHHIYGIPFIPSSAIKGVVRSYIEEIKRLDEFIDMFGDNKRGQIVFFDAFPITEPKIKMDIINPMEENKIINFLTVEDTTFQFLLASKEEIDSGFVNLFKEALTNHGIGAKTAVGYGYFE